MFDNLSSGRRDFLSHHGDVVSLVTGDLLDLEAVKGAMEGIEIVYHLAANPDIRLGTSVTDTDLKQGTVATYNVLEAMRVDEFPEITFRLKSYEASGQGAATTGTLTILDSTKEGSFPLSLTPSGAGVRMEGELALDMTTYGVEPPVVMFGLMRVRPLIHIQFSGIITP